MAFTTQPGVDGAPTTFEGTEGADSIAILGDNVNNIVFDSFIARGLGGNDTINYSGTRSDSTIQGGQGDDLITQNIVGDGFLASSFVAGNQGNDTIGNATLGIVATLSTLQGGQGEDRIFAATIQSTLVAGNLGDDFLSVDDTFGFIAVDSSSVWGGQGDDTIDITTSFVNSSVTNTSIAGNLGNDIINLDVIGSFAGSVADGGDGDDLIDAVPSVSDLSLIGGTGDDTIYGGGGDDAISGQDDDDWLAGDFGSDTVEGGKGNDLVTGSFYDGVDYFGDFEGDTLSGGTGSNRFLVAPGSSSFATYIDAGIGGIVDQGDAFVAAFGGTFDVITDWNSGNGTNLLDTGIAGLTTFAGFGPGMSLGFGFFLGSNYAVRGNYAEDGATFVVDLFGTDIAVWNFDGALFSTNVTILDNVNPGILTTNVFLTENQFVSI
ncbi:hypothetical protein KBY93_07815 [Synechococcus sp. J7-Johnson]|uniref:calcium-binding protein n=1 Tax=Synechococcus sp. J7-Johnson TaxID=2823737 RepID=UPI0020CC5EAF|nr:calcium-binding protein [Synechococcus sp. J7-Johnson]MCP9840542.1 hypothetical protein [Synechococcus sp. J7-Johnson]